jgi:hypothetical protein
MKGSGMRVSESGLMENEKDTERSMENKDITKRDKVREQEHRNINDKKERERRSK